MACTPTPTETLYVQTYSISPSVYQTTDANGQAFQTTDYVPVPTQVPTATLYSDCSSQGDDGGDDGGGGDDGYGGDGGYDGGGGDDGGNNGGDSPGPYTTIAIATQHGQPVIATVVVKGSGAVAPGAKQTTTVQAVKTTTFVTKLATGAPTAPATLLTFTATFSSSLTLAFATSGAGGLLNDGSGDKDAVNTGALVGGIVGGTFVLAVLLGGLFTLSRRRARSKAAIALDEVMRAAGIVGGRGGKEEDGGAAGQDKNHHNPGGGGGAGTGGSGTLVSTRRMSLSDEKGGLDSGELDPVADEMEQARVARMTREAYALAALNVEMIEYEGSYAATSPQSSTMYSGTDRSMPQLYIPINFPNKSGDISPSPHSAGSSGPNTLSRSNLLSPDADPSRMPGEDGLAPLYNFKQDRSYSNSSIANDSPISGQTRASLPASWSAAAAQSPYGPPTYAPPSPQRRALSLAIGPPQGHQQHYWPSSAGGPMTGSSAGLTSPADSYYTSISPMQAFPPRQPHQQRSMTNLHVLDQQNQADDDSRPTMYAHLDYPRQVAGPPPMAVRRSSSMRAPASASPYGGQPSQSFSSSPVQPPYRGVQLYDAAMPSWPPSPAPSVRGVQTGPPASADEQSPTSEAPSPSSATPAKAEVTDAADSRIEEEEELDEASMWRTPAEPTNKTT